MHSGSCDEPALASGSELDPAFRDAIPLANKALHEFTAASSIGGIIEHQVLDEHTTLLHFQANLGGYPGWRWTVALARADSNAPVTVLETQLTPGDESLLAPEWVPWSVRLSDYKEQQKLVSDVIDDDDDEDDDDVDNDDNIGDEFDDELVVDFDPEVAHSALNPQLMSEQIKESEPEVVSDDTSNATSEGASETAEVDDQPTKKPKRRRFWQRRSKA